MLKKAPNFTWSWREGRFWDMWMFTHILAGVVLGLLFELLELGFMRGFMLSVALMIAWEIGEVFFDIEETVENRILDVVYGMIAYSITYSIAVPLTPLVVGVVLVFSVIVKGAVEYRGWKAYRKRVGKSR